MTGVAAASAAILTILAGSPVAQTPGPPLQRDRQVLRSGVDVTAIDVVTTRTS